MARGDLFCLLLLTVLMTAMGMRELAHRSYWWAGAMFAVPAIGWAAALFGVPT